MKKRLPLLVLLFCLFSSLTFAQGIVKGIVTDKKNNDPLPGSTITLKNLSSGATQSMSAGLDGTYTFKNVADGKYEIVAKYISYTPASKQFTMASTLVTINLSPEPKNSTLDEVTITTSGSKATDQSAINAVRRADQVLNAVSAKTIEVSPDITVANVMQRVSGISIERSNNGEGQYAIIRGMEKRYTYTLINGYKIPSPDNKNRYVPLDIFPADTIDRLEVYKSLTPSMEGDAVAGGVNLVLKDAPDDFMVRANLGLGFSQSVADNGFVKFGANDVSLRSPRIIHGNDYVANLGDLSNNGQHLTHSKMPLGTIGGISIGGRGDDKKFGALVSLSYQDIFKDTKGTFFGTDVDAVTNLPKLTSIESRQYNTEQERTSAIGRFDYKFNRRNKLTLDAAYINLTQNQYRYTSDTSLTLARTGIGQGRITEEPRTIHNVQKMYNFSLRGDHKLADDFSMNWIGVYSKATANENRYELNLVTARTLQSSGAVVQDPLTIDASNGFAQTFAYNSDQDKSGYLNFVYAPKIGNTKVEFSAGGMYRNKTRSSTFDEYTETLPVTNATQVYNGNIDNNTFELVSNRQGTPGDALNYDFTENVGAAYGQFKFTIGSGVFQVHVTIFQVIGIRVAAGMRNNLIKIRAADSRVV